MLLIYVGGGPGGMTWSIVIFAFSLLLNSNLLSELHEPGPSSHSPPSWEARRAASPPRYAQRHEWSYAQLVILAGLISLGAALWGLMRHPSFAEHWVTQRVRRAWDRCYAAADTLLQELIDMVVEGLHGPEAEGARRGHRRERLTKARLDVLPTEEFVSEAELRQQSPSALKEALRKLQREAELRMSFSGGSASRDVQRLLKGGAAVEKDELVRAVLAARGGDSGLSCAICIGAYESGSKIRILPCGHRFHCECVDQWLTAQSRTCPLCSRRV